mgnify:CR=1 FL=1
MPAEIDALWQKGAEWLKAQGAEIVEISAPHFEYGVAAYYVILPAEASSNLAKFDATVQRLGNAAQDRIEAQRLPPLGRAAFWARETDIDPRDPVAGSNLANALRTLGRIDQGLERLGRHRLARRHSGRLSDADRQAETRAELPKRRAADALHAASGKRKA